MHPKSQFKNYYIFKYYCKYIWFVIVASDLPSSPKVIRYFLFLFSSDTSNVPALPANQIWVACFILVKCDRLLQVKFLTWKKICLRFAIDWCPAKRLLIFLKSATTVCHLELDEGYPSSGCAKLLAVRKDGNLLNLSALQVKLSGKILLWLNLVQGVSCVSLKMTEITVYKIK